jgi:cell wall-associated NlpC family hydrolase
MHTRPRNSPVLLTLLCALLLAGCASAPRTHAPSIGERIAASALAQVGHPYRYGGSTPDGFDCSGLVQFAYLAAGLAVPRTTADQVRAARDVKIGKLAPGDLLFFRIDSRKITHVGIYAGDGRFVHAPQTGSKVEVRTLDDAWYRARLVRAGRIY